MIRKAVELFPYLVAVSLAMACFKLGGLVDYEWGMVSAPMWATYIALGLSYVLWLGNAAIVLAVTDHLTRQRESGRLEP